MSFDHRKSVVVICPYPHKAAPGQRFRYELFLNDLNLEKIEYDIYSFLDNETRLILYRKGHYLSKIYGVIKGFGRRMLLLFKLRKYDFVFLHREVTPIGPPVFEWFIAKVLNKKIIYDFDDSIYAPIISDENRIINSIRWTKKVGSICKWSYKVSCGNEFLATYSRKYSSSVFVIPTVVDTDNWHNQIKDHKPGTVTIGWTGSHTTNKYLKMVLPVLRKLQEKYRTKFLVISNQDPDLKDVDYKFLPWNENTEISDLLRIDIGIMPLQQHIWAKGKCGFKAIQYLALGIPAVASSVGVNKKIVLDQKTGFLADTNETWFKSLEKLILDVNLRKKLGENGRTHIVESYSKNSVRANFLNLFT